MWKSIEGRCGCGVRRRVARPTRSGDVWLPWLSAKLAISESVLGAHGQAALAAHTSATDWPMRPYKSGCRNLAPTRHMPGRRAKTSLGSPECGPERKPQTFRAEGFFISL